MVKRNVETKKMRISEEPVLKRSWLHVNIACKLSAVA